MLVFSRLVGETIHIGSEIVVQLTAIRIGRVRVSIRAPLHISIDRPETRMARHQAPAPEDTREHQTKFGLLVLSRRPGECILIGDDIEVRILGFQGNGVTFGITARPDVAVDRGEVYLRKQAERRALEQAGSAACESAPDERRAEPNVTYRRRRPLVPTD